MLERFIAWLNHQHEWEYAGNDTTSGHEGYWYWHREECRYCDKTRTVMNSKQCACGGRPDVE